MRVMGFVGWPLPSLGHSFRNQQERLQHIPSKNSSMRLFQTVEFRLSKIRRSLLQYLICLAQFPNLALKILDPGLLLTGGPVAGTSIL